MEGGFQSISLLRKTHKLKLEFAYLMWPATVESNHEPSALEAGALPVELVTVVPVFNDMAGHVLR
jgi:hypothetical protein